MTAESSRSNLRHLYLLDAVRGLAALAVVFWHWQHFYSYDRGSYVADRQPFFFLFSRLYKFGWLAVPVFFTLSGFIFFWLYAKSVESGRVSAWRFAVARFSRLYPLHLLTLIVMAGLQWGFHKTHGYDFINQTNDVRHFVLHLFFASNWWTNEGSFNGPIWSVSIEVILYVLFFALCRKGLSRWYHCAGLAVLGYCLGKMTSLHLPEGIFWFFAGALGFKLWAWIESQKWNQGAVIGVLTIACVLSFVLPTAFAGEIRIALLTFRIPLVIVSLAYVEPRIGSFPSKLAIMGQLSYSSYLLHFPLQLIFAWLAPKEWFYSRTSFVAYFGLLIPLSVVSFRCFELPLQKWLRATLSPEISRESASARLAS